MERKEGTISLGATLGIQRFQLVHLRRFVRDLFATHKLVVLLRNQASSAVNNGATTGDTIPDALIRRYGYFSKARVDAITKVTLFGTDSDKVARLIETPPFVPGDPDPVTVSILVSLLSREFGVSEAGPPLSIEEVIRIKKLGRDIGISSD